MAEPRVRRRKCRRPRFASADKALRYARMVLKEEGRTAYECSAHVPSAFHLVPKAAAKVLDTPTAHGA